MVENAFLMDHTISSGSVWLPDNISTNSSLELYVSLLKSTFALLTSTSARSCASRCEISAGPGTITVPGLARGSR